MNAILEDKNGAYTSLVYLLLGEGRKCYASPPPLLLLLWCLGIQKI